ncbi:CoA ester lyase [Aurantimonas sp. 22II-16-19i]|uniref:HpcH/HpaI aldolase/citrate lyase family protein n=1 Tax=Aurantimonas sp. 22II-16-19i TaxID=1317114 RepID=UPI0009F7D11E|nr:CoA ester lyase [Aurantimonas sp. 22II-16-19i]ORE94880.1 citrate (pro-3S)-lyase [Aurantimonas sp. 22II-16-19i]
MTELLLRSLLFVPAANPRALEKSDGLLADGLIYDLEDSVAPEAKEDAREALRDHLAAGGFSGFRIVRINPLETREGAEDLLMARGAGIDAVLLPKVEDEDGLRDAARALDEMDAPAKLRLWAMIETPRGVAKAEKIARKGVRGRLSALVVGPNDIRLATNLRPDAERTELLPWLMQIVLAAKANGLSVLDGVYGDFRDVDGFERECAAGRRMGFDGKTLIHPRQIDMANAAFAPSPAEIAEAEAIVAAFARPQNAGRGVIQIDGRMIERLHLTEARRVLAMRDAIAARGAAA